MHIPNTPYGQAASPCRRAALIAQGEFGKEDRLDQNAQRKLGFNRDLIQESNLRHKDLMATLEVRISDLENVDMHTAVTELLDQSQSLEASFKAIVTLRGLSLMNFL